MPGQWTHKPLGLGWGNWLSVLKYLSQSDCLYVLGLLDCRGQVLISCLGNKYIILDSHAADGPVLLQHICVNELAVLWVLEVRFDDEPAEVDLITRIS